MPEGRWLTHAAAHSDLERLAAQLNPVLIQTSTPSVNPDLLCRLYVPQNKANPDRVVAFPRNEIRYNAPSVSWLSPASAELCRLPADQTGKSWTFRTASHGVKPSEAYVVYTSARTLDFISNGEHQLMRKHFTARAKIMCICLYSGLCVHLFNCPKLSLKRRMGY